ncbi:hypothetical protein [Dyella silvatica]|uniref:hypothetical protein n=1 Tax=Dyella silvatica TaxID=2992128 RepID=UPI00224EDB88|nr:hypothetical protein [Dyella silvatica]
MRFRPCLSPGFAGEASISMDSKLNKACKTTGLIHMEHAAVLPPNQAESVLKQCSRPTPQHVDGTWVVPPTVVMQLESDLNKLSSLKPKQCCISDESVRNPESYVRQYVGITIRGRQYVYINAFHYSILSAHSKERDLWKHKPVMVCDGGDAFWGALYDPETREFSELAFNGVA